MAKELLLVGSIPLDTPEEVLRTFGGALGRWLDYLPDGEIGDRRYWIDGIAYRVLNGHPEIETIRRPAPDANGVERWRPLGVNDQFQFRVKPGVERVRFGDPGWRLGYTRDAVNSYYVFSQLKKEGAIPAHLRFQVCLPLTWSACAGFFPDPADRARVIPGFTTALAAEVAQIAAMIPPTDLAIQWDLAVENRHLEPMVAKDGVAASRKFAQELAEPAREVCARIPDDVALGYHSCYGTLNGWPSRQPGDMAAAVLLLNECVAASGRRVDFLHFPTLGTATDAFFAHLKDLKPGDAHVYVGAVHHMHDELGLRAQMKAVAKYLPAFGLSAPCGFGRTPERPGNLLGMQHASVPAIIERILDDHRRAVDVLHDFMQH